jgi:hypothetical protein
VTRDNPQDRFMAAIAEAAPTLPLLAGLYLAGSHGRGSADRWSDIDYVAVAAKQDSAQLAEAWRLLVSSLCRPVLLRTRNFGTILINLVSDEWLRCDLIIEPEEAFRRRLRDELRPVYEARPLLSDLPPGVSAPREADPAALARTVEEFVRVLGLLEVVIGRNEIFTAQAGVALLRDLVRQFLLELSGDNGRSGALHLSRQLSAADMAFLNELAVGGATKDKVLAAHAAIALRFLPIARARCLALKAEWPGPLLGATARILRPILGEETADKLDALAH